MGFMAAPAIEVPIAIRGRRGATGMGGHRRSGTALYMTFLTKTLE